MGKLASWCESYLTDQQKTHPEFSTRILSVGHYAIKPLIQAICDSQQNGALILHAGLCPLAVQQQKVAMTVKNAAQLINMLYSSSRKQKEKDLIAAHFKDIFENGLVREIWAAALVLYETQDTFAPESASWISLSFPRMYSNAGPQDANEMHAYSMLSNLVLKHANIEEVTEHLHKHARSVQMSLEDCEQRIVDRAYEWFTISR